MQRMKDALVYWIGMTEEQVHFLDAIISAYDGIASVRREYRLRDGETQYKVYVSRGMEDEFLEVVARFRRCTEVGSLVREEEAPDATSPSV